MKNKTLLDVDCIEYANFDLERCEKKENLAKMLENLTPTPIEKIDFTGSKWDFGEEYYDEITIVMNGGELDASDLIGDLIEPFLDFLLKLASTDDKKLVSSVEYEGYITAICTTPQENNNIRVSMFPYYIVRKYNENNKFSADFVINKDVFLKQVSDFFQNVVDDSSKKELKWDRQNISRIKYTLKELDKYFKNPDEYKKNYDDNRCINVYKVAYKTLDNNWQFITAIGNEKEASILHWEREKNAGRILDYHFEEQLPDKLYIWDSNKSELVKIENSEIRKHYDELEQDMENYIEKGWAYSPETKKWYAPNEIMPYFREQNFGYISFPSCYSLELNKKYCSTTETEDEEIESYIEACDGDYLGYLHYTLNFISDGTVDAIINFDYRNHKEIREGLEKVKNGEYARFYLDSHYNSLHIWQELYHNSESTNARDIRVAYFDNHSDCELTKEKYYFKVNKNAFIDCFTQALDEIENKINNIKHIMNVAKELNIKEKFVPSKYDEIVHLSNFVGDYACVYLGRLDGSGIINKNFEWVVGTNDKSIEQCLRIEPVDGKLFIATKSDNKKSVIDLSGDIKIKHVSDEIYFSYLNDRLIFVFTDEDKTYFTDGNGNDILSVDYKIDEKFWLFDEIIIASKNNKYGIIDWSGNLIIDFIFSDINPQKDNLDFIPVKYMDRWGFINKKGEVIDMKIKE